MEKLRDKAVSSLPEETEPLDRSTDDFRCRNKRTANWLLLLSPLSAGLLAIAPLVLCLWYVATYGVDVPVYDELRFLEWLQALEKGSLHWPSLIFLQHNQHNLGLPFLVALGLSRFTNYDTHVEMFVCAACAIGSALVLSGMTVNRVSVKQHQLWLVVPMTWLACSLRQEENFLCGIGMPVAMASFFIVLTVFLLDGIKKPGLKLSFGFISGAAAMLCFSTGLVVLPLGAFQLLLSRLTLPAGERKGGYQPLICWVAFSFAVGTLYALAHSHKKYVDSYGINLDYILHHPFDIIDYFLAYLGSPLVASSSGPIPNANGDIASALGLILLGLLCVLATAIARSRPAITTQLVAPISFIVAALSVAVGTVLSRGRLGTVQATMSRYVAFSYLLVIGLYLTALTARKLSAHVRLPILGALVALIAVGSFEAVRDGVRWGDLTRNNLLLQANLLRTHSMQDWNSLKAVADPAEGGAKCDNLKNGNYTFKLADYLASKHMSVFRQPAALPLLPANYNVKINAINEYPHQFADGLCIFHVDNLQEKYLHFIGFALDHRARHPVSGLTLRLDNQVEIPLAYGLSRPDLVQALQRDSVLRAGFECSVLTSAIQPGIHSVSFRVTSPDGKSCSITPNIALLEVYDQQGKLFGKANRSVCKLDCAARMREEWKILDGHATGSKEFQVVSEHGHTKILLPDAGPVHGVCRLVKVKMVSPAPSQAQLFYLTAHDTTRNWQKSTWQATRIGENILYFMLPDFAAGQLRLDLGSAPGTYCVQEIDMRDLAS